MIRLTTDIAVLCAILAGYRQSYRFAEIRITREARDRLSHGGAYHSMMRCECHN
jgi:hypothetical protein